VILHVPGNAMLVLVGPSGAGKSTFAARNFLPTQILSSDAMRAVVADDPNDQSATDAAFSLLHVALGLRLAGGRLSVVDATNVEDWARRNLLAIARRQGRPASALVFALPLETCLERNAGRADRRLPERAIRRQHRLMVRSLGSLAAEGFDPVWTLESPRQANAVRVKSV